MPCEDCFELIHKLGIRRVVYSINDKELCKMKVYDLKPNVRKSLGRRFLNEYFDL